MAAKMVMERWTNYGGEDADAAKKLQVIIRLMCILSIYRYTHAPSLYTSCINFCIIRILFSNCILILNVASFILQVYRRSPSESLRETSLFEFMLFTHAPSPFINCTIILFFLIFLKLHVNLNVAFFILHSLVSLAYGDWCSRGTRTHASSRVECYFVPAAK